MKEYIKYSLIVGCVMFLSSCKSEYTKAVEEGLASGIVHDSLIFGMHMGQTKKDFYRICWDLNKQGTIMEGPGNMSARYVEPYAVAKDSTFRREMLFYGIFDDKDVMNGMDMTYSYSAYGPWDSLRIATALVKDLKEKFMKDYPGQGFIEIPIAQSTSAFAKIDGNRQILIYAKNNKDVSVRMEDLRYKYAKK